MKYVFRGVMMGLITIKRTNYVFNTNKLIYKSSFDSNPNASNFSFRCRKTIFGASFRL